MRSRIWTKEKSNTKPIAKWWTALAGVAMWRIPPEVPYPNHYPNRRTSHSGLCIRICLPGWYLLVLILVVSSFMAPPGPLKGHSGSLSALVYRIIKKLFTWCVTKLFRQMDWTRWLAGCRAEHSPRIGSPCCPAQLLSPYYCRYPPATRPFSHSPKHWVSTDRAAHGTEFY